MRKTVMALHMGTGQLQNRRMSIYAPTIGVMKLLSYQRPSLRNLTGIKRRARKLNGGLTSAEQAG